MGKHFHVQFVRILNGESAFGRHFGWESFGSSGLEEEKEKQEEGIRCRRAVENISDVFVFQFG